MHAKVVILNDEVTAKAKEIKGLKAQLSITHEVLKELGSRKAGAAVSQRHARNTAGRDGGSPVAKTKTPSKVQGNKQKDLYREHTELMVILGLCDCMTLGVHVAPRDRAFCCSTQQLLSKLAGAGSGGARR